MSSCSLSRGSISLPKRKESAADDDNDDADDDVIHSSIYFQFQTSLDKN